MRPSITVVTPWWGHMELQHDYWMAMRAADANVLVIDNASDPPLPNGWRLPTNQGFSPACNEGLRVARTDAVVFVNNDVYATDPDWLTTIQAALDYGVLVGPQLRHTAHANVDGIPLPYLDGWCLAGMKHDLLEIGGWDESFEEPSYYGDNDLCLRARANGMVLREVKVGLHHKLNQTTGGGSSPFVAGVTRRNYERFSARVRELFAEEEAA